MAGAGNCTYVDVEERENCETGNGINNNSSNLALFVYLFGWLVLFVFLFVFFLIP